MIPVTVNGQWELLLPEHRAARPDWTTEKGWERARLDAMHRNLKSGDIVFDIGAEEGDLSALFASWIAPEGGVVLFEPNPKVWPNIRAIWEANELPPPLGWFVGFASDRTELEPPNLDIVLDAGDVWPSCVYGELIGDHGFRHLAEQADATPQITLDDFVKGSDTYPDVITMDVEGAERAVLLGAFDVLAKMRPLVFVSVHPSFMRDLYREDPDNLHALMAAHGYTGVHLGTDHEEHWAFFHPEGRELVS